MRTLTIVVPVTKMAGKLQNMSSWLSEAKNFDVRVIIVHDCQDEDTSDELKMLIEKMGDIDISYFEMKFGSPGLARNQGLFQADSSWIMFVDSDDFVDMEQVFFLIQHSDHSQQILIGNYSIATGDGSVARPVAKKNRDKFDVAMNPGLWRIIFPLNTAREHRFTSFRMGEDQEYLLGLDIFSQDIFFSNNLVYTYYTHNPMQLTSNPKAISELGQVIPLTFMYLKKSSGKSGFYISVVLIRQILTELKNHSGSKFELLKRRLRDFWKLSLLNQLQFTFALYIFVWKKISNA